MRGSSKKTETHPIEDRIVPLAPSRHALVVGREGLGTGGEGKLSGVGILEKITAKTSETYGNSIGLGALRREAVEEFRRLCRAGLGRQREELRQLGHRRD